MPARLRWIQYFDAMYFCEPRAELRPKWILKQRSRKLEGASEVQWLRNCGSRALVSADFLLQVGNAKIGFAITKFFGGLPGKAGITTFNLVEFALGKLFDVEHGIVASFRGAQ